MELSNAPVYKALSYDRGAPGEVETISVNDVVFYVQRNSYQFLEQIRARYLNELPISIWVDAVCINQGNDHAQNGEKNHQVRLMGQIYSSAEMVLAYVGKLQDVYVPLVEPTLKWSLKSLQAKSKFADLNAGLVHTGEVNSVARRLVVDFMRSESYDDIPGIRDIMWHWVDELASQSYWRRDHTGIIARTRI